MHLPWSPGLQNDDRLIESLDAFEGEEVVVTEKMDGENTSMYRDYIHCRSLSELAPHPSRSRIRQLFDVIKHDIPENYRLCGENCFAKHSIFYDNLPSYFLLFSIWEKDRCLSWSETKEYAELLNLHTVPVLYEGAFENVPFDSLYDPERNMEGYVIRVSRSFYYSEFQKVVAKYVRKNHVQTSKHWMVEKVIENKLC